MIRKIIQIAVEPRHWNGGRDFEGGPMETDSAIWALCNDGTLYYRDFDVRNSEWIEVRLPNGVETDDESDEGPDHEK